jgi:hypothetical protein
MRQDAGQFWIVALRKDRGWGRCARWRLRWLKSSERRR